MLNRSIPHCSSEPSPDRGEFVSDRSCQIRRRTSKSFDAGSRLFLTFLVCFALIGTAIQVSAQTTDYSPLIPVFGEEATYWQGFCQDLDSSGQPLNPPRPQWSALQGDHWDSTQENPTSRYPDYRNISNNLRILQSLQFILSVLTNVTNKVEDAQQQIQQFELADLGGIDQTQGHCLCLGDSGCSLQAILDEFEELFDQLIDQQDLLQILESFSADQVAGAKAQLTALHGDLQEAVAADGDLTTRLEQALFDALDQEIQTQLNLLSPSDACQAALPIDPEDLETAVAAALVKIRDRLLADIETVRTSLQNIATEVGATLPQIEADIAHLHSLLQEVSQPGGLPPAEALKEVQTLLKSFDTYQSALANLRGELDQLRSLWNGQSYIADLGTAIRQEILQQLESSDFAPCIDDLNNLHQFPTFSSASFEQQIEAILQGEIDALSQRLSDNILSIEGRLQDLQKDFLDHFNMAADELDIEIPNCYEVNFRPQCIDRCNSLGTQPLWFPADFHQDPKKAALDGAQAAAMFALKQTGWLDKIRQWLEGTSGSSGLQNELSKGLGEAVAALYDLQKVVQSMIDFLGKGLEYVDHFTEGSHLGAYSVLRPDLHLCVPYAGHGAYAQLGNLGGDRFSLGARYTSHNLSRRHRVAFRSGGFAASAFGRDLSLLPAVELTSQIHGFRLWDPQRPLGIPLSASVNLDTVEKLDVFHVAPTGTFNGGQNGSFPLGKAIVRDLFPSKPAANDDPDWPRRGVSQPWEDESTAVISAGLNLNFELPKKTWELPTLVIIPPAVLTATPRFHLAMGSRWTHQSNLFRDRITEMVNVNLPEHIQLSDKDFQREMHAFQAPDLSTDNRTAVFVEPGVGIDAFLGFRVWKVSIGAGAHADLSVKLRPGGQGGVLDLNTALSDAVTASNPPVQAECRADLSFERTKSCSNERFRESVGSYACEAAAEGSSCCITVIALGVNHSLCVDDWTGLSQSQCEALGTKAPFAKALQRLEASGVIPQMVLEQLRTLAAEQGKVLVNASWNQGASCRSAPCSDALPTFTTAGLKIQGLSECRRYGYCTSPDGGLRHDLTEAECVGETAVTTPNGRRSTSSASARPSRREIGAIDAGAIFTPYSCQTRIEETLRGWEGDGCHPLQQGFPSACACDDDTQCAPGEACNESSGLCQRAGSDGASGDDPKKALSCLAKEDQSCAPGRVFDKGACTRSCSQNAECAGSQVCEGGLCRPPHDIPFAEEVVWGVRHNGAPRHTINTYALSDFEALLLLKAGVYVEASFKLFGKKKTWTLLDASKAWDLGSTYKGWYQPGLSAQYDHECGDPSLPWPVTNHLPNSSTATPKLQSATNAANISSPVRHCGPLQGGGVCRYPDPLPVEPGKAGSVDEFLLWCKDDLPQHQEDPAPSSNDDLVVSISDTFQWGYDVGLEAWAENQLCVGGKTWDQWLVDLRPTVGEDGSVLDPGSLDGAECSYRDPASAATHNFPCADLAERMLGIWGCTDRDRPYAQWLESQSGVKLEPGTSNLDLDTIFQPQIVSRPDLETEGFPYDYENLLPELKSPESYQWLAELENCFDRRFEDPRESYCECSSDDQCDVEGGERCRDGRCELPRRRDTEGTCLQDDCEPIWEARECPIVELQLEIGPCCGDGIVQSSPLYSEECDPADGSASCNDRCQLEGARGACCLSPGLCLDDVLAAQCQGRFHSGLRCSEVESCRPPGNPKGACCDPLTGCRDDVTFEQCTRGTWTRGASCADLGGCAAPVTGACCSGPGRCRDDVPQQQCTDGTFAPIKTCEQLNHCLESQAGCSPTPSKMVAWWPLDDTTDTDVFERRGGAVGERHGGATTVPGKVRGALQLDGVDDFVEIPHHSSLNLGAGDFSIDLWLAAPPQSGVRVLVDKRSGQLRGRVHGFSLFLYNGRLGLQLADGPHTNYVTQLNVADGQWHHVTVTVDRDNPEGIRWYLDGQLVGKAFDPTPRSGSLNTPTPLWFGKDRFLAGRLAGRMDEVEIFRKVLTAQEIASIHRSGSIGKCLCAPAVPGLRTWWPFEGDASLLTDSRNDGPQNPKTGTLHGEVTPITGAVGQALDFRGGYLEAPANSANFSGHNFSINGWIRSTATYGTILDNRSRNGSVYRGHSLFVYQGKLGLQLADGRWSNYVSQIEIADGQWHHFAVTIDRDHPQGIRWFLDGKSVGGAQDPTQHRGNLVNGGPVRLGRRSFDSTGIWRGTLDEIQISLGRLSPESIWSIWAAGPDGQCPCLRFTRFDLRTVHQDQATCRSAPPACRQDEAPYFDDCGCGCLPFERINPNL
ncbi:MAG: LamG-like jellyroll fold domain-containing protein [Acidobacteriota bacterium]